MGARASWGTRLRSLFWWILGLSCVTGVVGLYYDTVSTRGGFTYIGDGDYYNLLLRGFKKGHLYLDYEPHPKLLTLENPYDPAQNNPYRLPDASFYKSHYYLYFGPTPVVTLMWPYQIVAGRELAAGGALFVFCSAGFLCNVLAWLLIRRRYFPSGSRLLTVLAILPIGFSTHLLSLAGRPMWWELAIAGGYCFASAALLLVLLSLRSAAKAWWTLGAGLCLGLAVGARPTYLFAAGILLIPIFGGLEKGRRWDLRGAWSLLTLGLCGVALAVFNYLRFDSPFEFGQKYQLAGVEVSKLDLFSVRYLAHNLYDYLLKAPVWHWDFPFIEVTIEEVNIRGYGGSEGVAGLAVTAPFVWAMLALVVVVVKRLRGAEDDRIPLLAMLVVATVPMLLLLACMFSSVPRYMVDFAWLVVLLGLCGVGVCEAGASANPPTGAAARSRLKWVWRGLVQTTFAGLFLASAAMGWLLLFDYHNDLYSRDTPERFRLYADTSRSTIKKLLVDTRLISGPAVLKVEFNPAPENSVQTLWRSQSGATEEAIVVKYLAGQEIQLGYVRAAAEAVWGRPVKWTANHTHAIELQLPTLYRRPAAWLQALVAESEFRQRSCVVAWFDGERALDLFAEPPPLATTGDQGVGRDFSGKVQGSSHRPFRDEEMLPVIRRGEFSTANGHPNSLRLVVRFPEMIDAAGEPLYLGGAVYGSDTVYVKDHPDGVVLAFSHFAGPSGESKPLKLDRNQPHEIFISLPSFNPAAFSAPAVGGVVRVYVDRQEVLSVATDCWGFSLGSEEIGHNSHGTTCGKAFRGWMLKAEWQVMPEELAKKAP